MEAPVLRRCLTGFQPTNIFIDYGLSQLSIGIEYFFKMTGTWWIIPHIEEFQSYFFCGTCEFQEWKIHFLNNKVIIKIYDKEKVLLYDEEIKRDTLKFPTLSTVTFYVVVHNDLVKILLPNEYQE